jgi:ankyrin repeat protein
MNKKLKQYIINNDLVNIKKLLTDSTIDINANDNFAFKFAIQKGFTNIVKLFLKDSRINPATEDNFAIIDASERGHLDIVKLLIKDSRVDPSSCHNHAIQYAFKNKRHNIVELLWRDKRVHKYLEKDNVNLYNQLTQQDVKLKINNF